MFLIKENEILMKLLLILIAFIGINFTLSGITLFSLPCGNWRLCTFSDDEVLLTKALPRTSSLQRAHESSNLYIFPRIRYATVLVWIFLGAYNDFSRGIMEKMKPWFGSQENKQIQWILSMKELILSNVGVLSKDLHRSFTQFLPSTTVKLQVILGNIRLYPEWIVNS